jgi:hypothetical protein
MGQSFYPRLRLRAVAHFRPTYTPLPSFTIKAFNEKSDITYRRKNHCIPVEEGSAFDPPLNSIKQIVWLKISLDKSKDKHIRSSTVSFAPEQFKPQNSANTYWRHPVTYDVAVLPLQDVHFGPAGLVRSLTNLMAYFVSILDPFSRVQRDTDMLGAAKSLALVSRKVSNPATPSN